MADPANKEHLLESIANEPQISFTAREFEKKAEELRKNIDWYTK
jgi:hypothetical protein